MKIATMTAPSLRPMEFNSRQSRGNFVGQYELATLEVHFFSMTHGGGVMFWFPAGAAAAWYFLHDAYPPLRAGVSHVTHSSRRMRVRIAAAAAAAAALVRWAWRARKCCRQCACVNGRSGVATARGCPLRWRVGGNGRCRRPGAPRRRRRRRRRARSRWSACRTASASRLKTLCGTLSPRPGHRHRPPPRQHRRSSHLRMASALSAARGGGRWRPGGVGGWLLCERK